MKVAVVGSRGLIIEDLGKYLPKETTEILSGGAIGVDRCAREYAHAHHIPIREFLPDYARYGRRAPLVRNGQMMGEADVALAFWDGSSSGTRHAVRCAREMGKSVLVVCIDPRQL